MSTCSTTKNASSDICCFRYVMAQRYYRASNLSVCPSVRPSVFPFVRPPVRYVPVSNENGLIYCHSFFTIRQPNHSSFTSIKHFHKIPTGSPPAGALNTGGVYKFRDFLPISCYISQTIQDIAILTTEGEQKLVGNVSNGAISNDLERTITLFSRSHHSLTLNISQTATDTMEGEQETAPKLSNGTNFNKLECPLTPISRSRYYSTSNNS